MLTILIGVILSITFSTFVCAWTAWFSGAPDPVLKEGALPLYKQGKVKGFFLLIPYALFFFLWLKQ